MISSRRGKTRLIDVSIMITVTILVVIGLFAGLAPYLTRAHLSQVTSLGHDCKIRLHCPNGNIEEWRSDGKVAAEAGTDGWFFTNRANGMMVRLSGSVSIEELPKDDQWQPTLRP